MLDAFPRHIDTILDIIHRHIPACEVRVFGSRILGKAKPYSDLDLALVGESKLDWLLIEKIKDELAESEIPYRVDLLDWHAISPEFRKIIETKYEVVRKSSC
ncbi:MAG: nucleotidyltransferase domain-containing protein [Candidatus Firestonebacteria bacterium]|nr:nucleotidyltransferase domain-containing protein [Candidatus Firestonebacteria bacterium]